MKQKRYIASGKPRSPYMTARVMGFSPAESKKMVKWVRALVKRVLAEEKRR